MARILEFTQQNDGNHTATFTSCGGLMLLQVRRRAEGLLYIEAGAEEGRLAFFRSEGLRKDALCKLNLPAGTVVRVVSHTPVDYAAIIGCCEEEPEEGEEAEKKKVFVHIDGDLTFSGGEMTWGGHFNALREQGYDNALVWNILGKVPENYWFDSFQGGTYLCAQSQASNGCTPELTITTEAISDTEGEVWRGGHRMMIEALEPFTVDVGTWDINDSNYPAYVWPDVSYPIRIASIAEYGDFASRTASGPIVEISYSNNGCTAVIEIYREYTASGE